MDELTHAPDVERILSGMRELLLMDEQGHIDSEALMLEVTRYLAAVEAFRTESCEPMWLPEVVSIRAAESQAPIVAMGSLASGNHLH